MINLAPDMRVRSTIMLFIWLSALGAPLLALQAEDCDLPCCVVTENDCPMQGEDGDCPTLEVGGPLHNVPALLAKPVQKQAGLPQDQTAVPNANLVSVRHSFARALSHFSPLPARSSPLLI